MAPRHDAEQLLRFSDLYRELTRDRPTIEPPAPGTWLVLTVDHRRRRHYRHSHDGHLWASGAIYPRLPYPSGIRNHKFLPDPGEDGAYLLIYGGGPEIYDHDDVVEKTGTLLEELPHRIADIVCYQRPERPHAASADTAQPPDGAASLWTVRGAAGIRRNRTTAADAETFPQATPFATDNRWAPTVLDPQPKEGT